MSMLNNRRKRRDDEENVADQNDGDRVTGGLVPTPFRVGDVSTEQRYHILPVMFNM